MHPAPSLILFTTVSGAGFGLMAWLGAGAGPAGGVPALLLALLALGLASAGLLASLAHLGNPQRAWRALSQWRSSWLSREGVAALAALGAFTAFAGLWTLGGERVPLLGALAALLAAATVACTAMIYAQLRTVPRWNTALTPALFLFHAGAAGAMLAGESVWGLNLLVLLGFTQWRYWTRPGATLAERGTDAGTATGLGTLGAVRAFEAPHTGPNWLLTEMVFRVGRARARALRLLAVLLGLLLPAAILAAGLLAGAGHGPALLAGAVHLAGAACGRWLFFAEAEHAVGLYYPR